MQIQHFKKKKDVLIKSGSIQFNTRRSVEHCTPHADGTRQGSIQDFLLGGGNHIFEEILDIFGQQNRRIQL